MIRNYFKIAWRNLWRSKAFSLINLLGLTLGITVSLLIMLWVQDERNVNAFHENSSRLYNVYEREFADGKINIDYSTPGLIARELKNAIPEVQYATSYATDYEQTFRVENAVFKQKGQYATEDFFKVFTYPLVEGNVEDALGAPESISLSKKMAEKFFGSAEAAMGKTVRCEDRNEFNVTAVFDDVPENSTFQFDYVINWQNFLRENAWALNFENTGPFATIKLKENVSPEGVKNSITHFLDNYNIEQSPEYRIELDMQRFDEMYLYSNHKNGYIDGGRIEYVNLFSLVAFFILIIACINFMNLSTARSVKRAKEIGIRKVVGAPRSSLIYQFIGEAILITSLALIVALILLVILLPVFNTITAKTIEIPVSSFLFWSTLAALVIVIGFVAGIYPAFFLSKFKPVKVLKGIVKTDNSTLFLRKGLVVFQFVLSVILIVGTIIVSQQVSYIQTKNLGFERENLVYIPLEGQMADRYELFKKEALKEAGIKEISKITNLPTNIDVYTTDVEWKGKSLKARPAFANASVGYDFIKALDAEIIEGRDFSTSFPSDSMGFIINETALQRIGYKDPIGSPLKFWDRKGTIVGVVKDFHFRSLHEAVKPLILRFNINENYGSILVRTEAGKTELALANLEKIYKELNPQFPFSYRFSDDEYQTIYKTETTISKLSNYFSFIAIFISCLGLLGLVIFTAEQRRKEIGIRKVLGASVLGIIRLMSKDFLKLIFVAIAIAIPLAWYAMQHWLQGYAYRIEINWWVFLVAGAAAISIALVTVSFQAIKAAIANPVNSLRTE